MMLGRVFEKLLFISIVILAIAFILVTTFVSSIFSRQFISIRYNELENEAAIIKYLMDTSVNNHEDLMSSEVMSAAGRYKAKIWIVDRDMNITKIIDGESISENNGTLDEDTKQYFESVIAGENLERIGTFGSRINKLVMTYGTPMVVNGETVGAIFIHSDLDDLQTYLNSITGQVIISAITSLAVAIVLVYCMAQYFTKPLILMNNYAKKLAKGQFNLRVDINQKDEVGQLAESFNKMAQELKNLDDKRRMFIGDVSHELRAPLSAIQGYVQGLYDGTIDKKDCDRYMSIVLAETKRLNVLINDLLDLSQVDSGVYPLNAKSFSVTDLINRILRIFEGTAENKSVEIVYEAKEKQIYVYADEERLTQVISNFIDNAIKFSPILGKVTIDVHEENAHVCVEVKDQGPGLSEEDINNIWEPFYQVDRARTPGDTRGTGLGLFIAKSIIDQHEDAEIGVKSILGEGATFYFILPQNKL